MKATVDAALRLWGMEGADAHLIAARENAVFRVAAPGGPVALRLHRQGYRSDAELRSELHWMAAVAKGGLSVPAPIPACSGDVLHVVDGTQVDVLTWLSGAPASDVFAAHPNAAYFHSLGMQMARLHATSDAWTPPKGFTRPAWDRAGLLGDAPLWGRFWENPSLSDKDNALFHDLRDAADEALTRLAPTLDYGLIHADLVSTNVMVDGNTLHLIDFDDGGYGFRLFELATALLKHHDAPDFPALRAALLDGYRSVRAIDTTPLDLFMVLRAATYVGWIVPRMQEDGAQARAARFARTLRTLATDALGGALAKAHGPD